MMRRRPPSSGKQYRRRGYDEVITPNVYNADLWRTSGHWQHYQENMFQFTDGEASKRVLASSRSTPQFNPENPVVI